MRESFNQETSFTQLSTTSLAVRLDDVPIPILPLAPYIQFPILSWLDAVLDTAATLDPMMILFAPVVMPEPAIYPIAILLFARLALSAWYPIATLLSLAELL